MTTVEERSDQLDQKLMVVPVRLARDVRRIFLILGAAILGGAIAVTAMFLYLSSIADDARKQGELNHDAITVQIPGLKMQVQARERQVDEKNEQLADADYVINQQLIPAVLAMASQLQEAGLEPPCVRATPTAATFAEQQTQTPPCSG